MGTQEHPHQGEPSGQDPHYGEGGPAAPDVSSPEELERKAEQHAAESGEAAADNAGGGESGGMGGGGGG